LRALRATPDEGVRGYTLLGYTKTCVISCELVSSPGVKLI